jgi:hypothetical protein
VTAERRLRIGGWAALVAAILGPLIVVALFAAASSPDPFAAPAVVALEVARLSALLVAVIGLDGLFASIAAGPSRFARTAGVAGSILALGAALNDVTIAVDRPLVTLIGLIGSVLIGLWFIAGGAILMSAGRQLARVGWAAGIGGFGTIVAALAIATSFGGPIGVGTSWQDWFLLVSLFVVIYLVRVWSYVVRGKLPGPGIL